MCFQHFQNEVAKTLREIKIGYVIMNTELVPQAKLCGDALAGRGAYVLRSGFIVSFLLLRHIFSPQGDCKDKCALG